MRAVPAEHWDGGVYRQQLLWPSADERSFAGSCAVSGTVTFDPPATNTPGPLTYAYDATGRCTGTFDGQRVSNAPVKMHQAGSSYGSCSEAQTTAPGQGTLSFAPDKDLNYTLDFTSTLTEVNFTLYGQRSGMAPAHG